MFDSEHSHPVPGTAEYDEHVQAEIEHYRGKYDETTLLQTVPQSWVEVERRSSELIRAVSGDDIVGHLVRKLNQWPGVRMLSLGSGPGGVEIILAKQARAAQIHCLDVNPEVLELGQQRAKDLDLKITFQLADLNTIELPVAEFDIVLCYAALHHIIELERLAEQIKRALRANGQFVIVDVITPNGYLMWPKTRRVVQAIFKTLPVQFRLNHTGYARPEHDMEIWEADTSASGMECIRSEDILGILDRAFENKVYVPYLSICRRFFDNMYGPNFDLIRPLDNAVFNWLWELDKYYLQTNQLKPETFFGIYQTRT